MRSNAKRHVYALFSNRDEALAAYAAVQERGCQDEHCSVLMQQDSLDPEELALSETAVREGAKKGALIVGGAGAIIVGLLALPGGFLGIGPLAAALFAGAWGAGFGGLLGAIAGASDPNQVIRTIEEEVRAGKVLVAVETDDVDLAQMCNDVFVSHGGTQLQ